LKAQRLKQVLPGEEEINVVDDIVFQLHHSEGTDDEDNLTGTTTTNQTKGRKKTNYVEELHDSFKSQGRKKFKVGESFEMRISASDVIDWSILPPGEQMPEGIDPLFVPVS
jgi:hypothetical protein